MQLKTWTQFFSAQPNRNHRLLFCVYNIIFFIYLIKSSCCSQRKRENNSAHQFFSLRFHISVLFCFYLQIEVQNCVDEIMTWGMLNAHNETTGQKRNCESSKPVLTNVTAILIDLMSPILHGIVLKSMTINGNFSGIHGISVASTEWLFHPLFPVRIRIWKC